jgi:periplasmic divalent cation tolerance protein
MEAIVVITTVGSEEQANTLARELVARRHAACVNIVPGLKTFYRWQGKLRHDTELMLVIKTLESEFEGVAATIRELHDYELPEILAFAVGHGEARFLAWIAESVDRSAAFAEDDEDDEPAFADPD